MTVQFKIKGVPEIVAFLKELPRGSRIVVLREIVAYLIGDAHHGLKHEVAYRYVHPFKSYSDDPEKAARQRRWQFAHLDQIGKNNRTHAIQSGWNAKEENSDWRRVKIVNEAEGVGWVFGDEQTRQSKAVGWRKAATVVSTNLAGALAAGRRALDQWLSEHNR